LVNHELSTRTDYTTAASYRQTFNANVSLLAKHFKGRIKYWEVWNEPNVSELARIAEIRYVPLLDDAHNRNFVVTALCGAQPRTTTSRTTTCNPCA
jgi:beta-glucosidase/6-phospho-beta-glucosidase/beta-galactosidase